MIDLKSYDLFYKCKNTGEVFRGRSLGFGRYKLFNPKTRLFTEYGKNKLRENFRSEKANRKVSPVRMYKKKDPIAS